MKKVTYERILAAIESYKYAWCAWHYNDDLSLDDLKFKASDSAFVRLLAILRAEVEDG